MSARPPPVAGLKDNRLAPPAPHRLSLVTGSVKVFILKKAPLTWEPINDSESTISICY